MVRALARRAGDPGSNPAAGKNSSLKLLKLSLFLFGLKFPNVRGGKYFVSKRKLYVFRLKIVKLYLRLAHMKVTCCWKAEMTSSQT